MKKLAAILFLFVINCFTISAYEMKIDTITIQNSGEIINQIIISINNTEADPIWIWFVDADDFRDDSVVIKEHLLKRINDFSLFDIATDHNMEGELMSNPITYDDFYNLFVKYLRPGDGFTVVFLEEIDNVNRKEVLRPNKKLKIYRQYQILEYCMGINTIWGIKRISYPFEIVVLQRNNGTCFKQPKEEEK